MLKLPVMTKLKTLSAQEVVSFLKEQGFLIDRQRGSHMVLVRKLISVKQVLTIPNHSEIDKGTLKAIYNQVKKFIPEEEVRKYFYTD